MTVNFAPQSTLLKAYQHLSTQLPGKLPGLQQNVPLRRYSWFRVGGDAALYSSPGSVEELSTLLAHLPGGIPISFLGGGSNILFRDGGVAGLVVRFGKAFQGLSFDGSLVTAGAGLADIHLAKAAAERGLAGTEFMIGIPGTLGGALAMNAGAHGHEVADIFVKATAMDRAGGVHTLTADDLSFGYRQSGLPEGMAILDVTLRLTPDNPSAVIDRMDHFKALRDDAQPTGLRTGGSTFKNPDGHRAWELIDQSGCRNLRIGGAAMSEKHCNFMVNTGTATAHDLESLGEEIRRIVKSKTGIALEWEIERLGLTDKQVGKEA